MTSIDLVGETRVYIYLVDGDLEVYADVSSGAISASGEVREELLRRGLDWDVIGDAVRVTGPTVPRWLLDVVERLNREYGKCAEIVLSDPPDHDPNLNGDILLAQEGVCVSEGLADWWVDRGGEVVISVDPTEALERIYSEGLPLTMAEEVETDMRGAS